MQHKKLSVKHYPSPGKLEVIAKGLLHMAKEAEEATCGTLGGRFRRASKRLEQAANLIRLAQELDSAQEVEGFVLTYRGRPADLEGRIWALINHVEEPVPAPPALEE